MLPNVFVGGIRQNFTLLHLWWSCALIQLFWKQVHNAIKTITGQTPAFTLVQYLLHDSNSNYGVKSLTMHLINAARQCLPQHWRSQNGTSLMDWRTKVLRIAEIERLIYAARDRISKYIATWASWVEYDTSRRADASKFNITD